MSDLAGQAGPEAARSNAPHKDAAIVIPCVNVGALTRKCIDVCSRICPQAEIIVLADHFDDAIAPPGTTRVVVTGPVTIAAKRNRGARETARRVIAFIDSDAYPEARWLDSAVRVLDGNPQVGAVAGPNVSPQDEPYSERIVGIALKSAFGSHNAHYIKRPAAPRLVDNVPTVNLIVRRDEYLAIGGMDERLFGGEDVEFCARLVKSGRPILYRPEILVYHKNRSLPEFIKQRLAYGGFAMETLLKRIDQTVDIKMNRTILISQLPTAFVLFLLSAPAMAIVPFWAYVWLPVASIYAVTIIAEACRHSERPGDIPGAALALAVATLAPGIGAISKLIGIMPHFRRFYRNDG